MKFSLRHNLPAAGLALAALILLPGCFTGIESTPRIKDTSRHDKDDALTAEQTMLAAAAPQPPADWQPGKRFIITEGRYDLAFTPVSEAVMLHRGDTLRFIEIKPLARLSGDTISEIYFSSPRGIIQHRIDVRPAQIINSSTLPIPFTIEADAVDSARKILVGRKAWTLKFDSKGEKFSPIIIKEIQPGTPDYPFTIIMSSGDSVQASSRTFSSLFSLSDPRLRYPQISDETWAKISHGQVAIGMSRDECRLALGAPKNVDRDVAYNALLERWTYENGVYLNFADGVLTSFRR